MLNTSYCHNNLSLVWTLYEQYAVLNDQYQQAAKAHYIPYFCLGHLFPPVTVAVATGSYIWGTCAAYTDEEPSDLRCPSGDSLHLLRAVVSTVLHSPVTK